MAIAIWLFPELPTSPKNIWVGDLANTATSVIEAASLVVILVVIRPRCLLLKKRKI